MDTKDQTNKTVEREYKGKVDFYKKRKGFGFIIPDGQEKMKGDIFVHFSDVELAGIKSLKPEMRLAFNVGDFKHSSGETRLKAVDIIVLND